MDTTTKAIRFNAAGVCNFCDMHDEMDRAYPFGEAGRGKLNEIVARIKEAGKGKKYDCICGTSGGRDSTYVLYLAKVILGLRPLAVHFDNGWNSAIASKNVYKVCKALDLDLETYVVDWEEFRDIQISMLKASTPDSEIPSDLAIHAVLMKTAEKEGVKYVLNGHSFRTEGIAPVDWTFIDGRYVEAVHRRFGRKPLRTYPNYKIFDYIKSLFVYRTKVVPIINFFPYAQEEVQKLLEDNLGWEYYGGHHYESYYTKFNHTYLLPKKFNIDKRRTEYAALVRSGYMDREEAVKLLSEPEAYDLELVEYTREKLELDDAEWNAILNAKPKSFRDYPSYYPLMRLARIPIYIASKLGLVERLLYLKYLG